MDYPFVASDIGQLQRIERDRAAAAMDQPSWSGLLVDPYFEMLTGQVSIFGKQVLHQRLCDGLADAPRAALAARLRSLMADPAQLDILRRATRPLRAADTEIATLLLEETLPATPKWGGAMWLLFVGLLASIAAVALSPLAWLGAAFFLYKLLAIQMRYHERVSAWERAMNALQMLLRASSLLGALKHPMLDEFAGAGQQASKVNRSLTRSPWMDMIPGMRAYLDWFLLANVKHYFQGIGVVGVHRQFLRDCYARCANLEADIALAQHLLRTPSTCWAERGRDDCIGLEQAVHPLLQAPAPLSLALHGKGAFISGQNGIGKSTLLRTVGLNLLVARAFGFCYAGKATVPMLPVYASMQSEDSLLGGESLYIAELQRAKELLAVAAGPHRATYIIDEIFRGTNHLESVSAAAAVLDVLAAGSVVIVSSHNLVLASLLEHRLAPFCVALGADGALQLAPGLLAHTNGIALLAQRGFGADIEAGAGRVFDWLSVYLAEPVGGNAVLA
ncbi:MAG: DNA mismatch repair protein MutS [Pseudomonadota bacterium]